MDFVSEADAELTDSKGPRSRLRRWRARRPGAKGVGEDGEELAARAERRGETGPGQRVRDRVGGERGPPLLAVGDDRGAGGLVAVDRVLDRGVLLLLERRLVDL